MTTLELNRAKPSPVAKTPTSVSDAPKLWAKRERVGVTVPIIMSAVKRNIQIDTTSRRSNPPHTAALKLIIDDNSPGYDPEAFQQIFPLVPTLQRGNAYHHSAPPRYHAPA
jgi:hypothetical protein